MPLIYSMIVIVVFILAIRLSLEWEDDSNVTTPVGVTLAAIMCITWWFGFDLDYDKIPATGYAETKHLVSIAPPQQGVSGNFTMFLGIGGGSIDTTNVYTLREKVSDRLYRDFTVQHEVYLEERPTLPKDKGLFVKHFTCVNDVWKYRMFVWEAVSESKQCSFNRQVIVVPEGYVIQEIKPI